MQSLDIPILCANTPQAKGRVERANETLQDRLVKEMRLCGINDMQQGNAYLPEFIADFNARFAVPAAQSLWMPIGPYSQHQQTLTRSWPGRKPRLSPRT